MAVTFNPMTEPLNFVVDGAENFTTYRLEDGSIIRLKVVLVAALPRPGEFTPDGTPIYDLQWQQIVHVTSPKHLRKEV